MVHRWSPCCICKSLTSNSRDNQTILLEGESLTSWIQQERWCVLREIIDELATIHYLPEPTVKNYEAKQDSLSVSDLGTVKVLPINASVSGRIQPLYSALQEKPVYNQAEVTTFALMDPKLKYQ